MRNQPRPNPRPRPNAQPKSSWEGVNKWYNAQVGEEGHYYHKNVILPALLPFFADTAEASLLDLGCGQGVLSRSIPKSFAYTGVDISPSLIKSAKSLAAQPNHEFVVSDATQKLPVKKKDFSHASIILALQNMEHQEGAIRNCATRLRVGGKLLIVLNHPCFRIPRQSSWVVDEQKKIAVSTDRKIHVRHENPDSNASWQTTF